MQETSAGVVVFRRDGRKLLYLVLLYGAGHWDLVKGHVEKDEDMMETVTREAEEEAGLIDLEFVPNFSERINYSYSKDGKDISKEVAFFLAETRTEEVKLSFEHKDYKWLPLDGALKQVTFDTAKKVLRKADKAAKSYASHKTL